MKLVEELNYKTVIAFRDNWPDTRDVIVKKIREANDFPFSERREDYLDYREIYIHSPNKYVTDQIASWATEQGLVARECSDRPGRLMLQLSWGYYSLHPEVVDIELDENGKIVETNYYD